MVSLCVVVGWGVGGGSERGWSVKILDKFGKFEIPYFTLNIHTPYSLPYHLLRLAPSNRFRICIKNDLFSKILYFRMSFTLTWLIS